MLGNSFFKILLIEDNIADAELILEMMNRCPSACSIRRSDRLSSALALLAEEDFDVVLLDLILPDSSGIDTFRRLQSQAPNVPVIVMTVLDDEELAAQGISLGAQDYLIKGHIESDLLVRSIRYAIERKRVEKQLKDFSRRNELILDAAGEGIFGLDTRGNHTFINKAAAAMLGYEAGDLIGRNSHATYHHSRADGTAYPAQECPIYAAYRDGTAHSGEEMFWRKDGTPFPVAYTSRPLLEGAKITGAVVTFKDITERKRAEEALRESEERFASFMRHLPAAAWIKDMEGRYVMVNAEAERVFSLPLQRLIGKTDFDIFPPDTAEQFTENDRRVLRENRTLQTIEVLRQADGIEHSSIVSKFTVPGPGGRPAFLGGVAFDITERKKAEDQIKRSKELSDAVNRINAAIFSMLDPDEIMNRVLEEAARATGADSGAIYMPAGDHWIARYVYGLPGLQGRDVTENDIRYSATAVKERKVVLINDVPRRFPVTRYGVKALLDAPLFVKDDVIGNFCLYSRSPGEVFSGLHADFISNVAASISLALRNADLFAETRDAREEARSELEATNLLLKAADALTASLDLPHILETLLDVTLNVTARSRAAILTLDRDSGEVEVYASKGDPQVRPGRRWDVKNLQPRLYESILEKKQVVFDFESAETPDALKRMAKEFNARLALYVPLVFGNEVIGIVAIDEPGSRREFSQRDIGLVEGIASEAAVSIENARLFEERKRTNERLSSVLSSITDSYFVIDSQWRLLEMNETAEREVFNRSAAELIGKVLWEEFPESRETEFFRNYKTAVDEKRPVHFEGKSRIVDRWFEAHAYPRDRRLEVYLRDITKRKKFEIELANAREEAERRAGELDVARNWLESVLQHIPAGVIIAEAPTGKHVLGNQQAERIWKQPFVQAEHIGEYGGYKGFHPDGSPYQPEEWPLARSIKNGEHVVGEEIDFLRGDGSHGTISVSSTPIRDREGRIIAGVAIFTDVTEHKRLEEEIRHLAHHDALTGLPNRLLFREIVELEIAQMLRNRKKLAVLFLDLDRFKEINDTLGHEVGDELLKQAAFRFRQSIRKSDTVARIGGDEFNIILPDIMLPPDISDIAQKIIDQFQQPFLIGGNHLNTTTSIGISVFPDDSEEIDTLLRYADIAMYHAKESGRNMYKFYNPSINVLSLERIRLENYLRQAIERGELRLFYQPQIDIKGGRIVCAEALVRWNHPEKGLLEPVEFIPLAEQTGLITSIDEWVLKSACAQVKSWQDAGQSPVCITVNLSSRQFQRPELVPMIGSMLRKTGMDPDCMDLEITEGTAMSDVERTASQLRDLRKMGVHISIDDFGTGYSSLNYLKKLPIERIKIDKSFIHDIAKDPDDRAIISAVTSMARKMGIRTVAEGVETEEQLAFLRTSECDEAQGFLFSRPVPVERLNEMLATGILR
jgi:diguanylate cyclase (GGDEF)-like protein/PAS domain S-box-containing protein